MGLIRIQDGCRRVGKKIIPVKQPCDYVLVWTGKCAFIDTKTQGAGQTFPVGHINMNQVHSMNAMIYHGAIGGYVVWFRVINKVVFFNCEQLRLATEGLHWTKGIELGSIEEKDLKRIFNGTI